MSKTIECLNSGRVFNMEDAPLDIIKNMYESCCQEYVRRLCEAWEILIEDAWWHGDEIGGGLFLDDWWASLDMQEIRYIVDNGVTYEAWMVYCAFMESEINNGQERPRINFTSWFRYGARPKDLKDGKDS